MKIQKLLLSLLLSAIGLCSTAAGGNDSPRIRYNFNSGWLLTVGDPADAAEPRFDDSGWKRVTLPHAWNEDDAFEKSIDKHSTGIAWYRKHFRLPASARGQKVFLEFEGIRFGGEVWLNGRHVALHENGVMAFGVDVTDLVSYSGDNVVAVRTDNDWKYAEKATGQVYQWNNINFNANYGGIPKNVYLHLTGKLYQTLPLYSNLGTVGTYVYARNINVTKRSADIWAETEVRNETGADAEVTLAVEIEDMEGKIIKQMSGKPRTVKAGQTATLKTGGRADGLHFWSWGYGYLYNVYTTLYVDGKPVDRVTTRTGFRKTRFADGMIWLNDRVLMMKGYAQRTSNEWPAVGMSVPAWLSDYSNSLIVEGNGNLVRWMHVTPWKQDVESCDRVGLIQAMPAGDAEKDCQGRQWEQRKELMRDAIIYNRNNPSILFYESGNESISEEHMAEMIAIRDQYDPYGGRAAGSREMLDSKIAEYGGEMLYINKSGRHPMWATEYCRDEALRKYWDHLSYPYHKDGDGPLHRNQPATSYNRNQDSYAAELVARWNDLYVHRPGTGRRVNSGGANIVFSDTNTHYRGAENYRRSGEVDAMRIPKDGFFAHQVMWNGWVTPEVHGTHIVGHWNYPPQTVKNVQVVSTGEQVELLLNGRNLGSGRRSETFLFTFDSIRWEPGTLTAVSYDDLHNELSRHQITTAGEPAAIRMSVTAAPDGFKADGADLALLEFEVVDAEGRRCPLANDLVSFEVNGPAEWRGGIAQGEGNYILSRQLPVECGINRALIRSTLKPGRVRITATAEGIAPASVELTAVACPSKNGLSTYISGEHQPSYLKRGATPAGPSYTVTRTPVEIVAATAGANERQARLSFDDNELSEWKNDGHVRTAWICYELEHDAEISQVVAKFTGWRMRSYPIRIYVDEQLVWSGNTERSLGYVTIDIPPSKGRFVKIELIGVSEESDAFSDIVEVTGNIELDLYRDPNAGNQDGQLRIVEIEFYENPGRAADKPLFRDPVYDGAADPVVVRNRESGSLYMFYTNRRANAPGLNGVEWVHGTAVGMAESKDGGYSWHYLGTADIDYGEKDYSFWAPDIIEHEGTYHMYLTVVPGIFSDWQHPRRIVHLTSSDLHKWSYVSTLPLSSQKVIDACVVRNPEGGWILFYNDEATGKRINWAVSDDLYEWTDKGELIHERGEGPKVFRFRDKYFMLIDTWNGQTVYSSDDLKEWTKQPERILEQGGTGADDGTNGLHADVAVCGERAYVIYFTHPGRTAGPGQTSEANSRRSSVQIAELEYRDGKLTCDRNRPVRPDFSQFNK
ncbi:MAG: family 43 glycosylhydrolase [Rikenellaceae bacterium]|nr:family 43 glycosylhydrolase [Rikenellaceae bacterium]